MLANFLIVKTGFCVAGKSFSDQISINADEEEYSNENIYDTNKMF